MGHLWAGSLARSCHPIGRPASGETAALHYLTQQDALRVAGRGANAAARMPTSSCAGCVGGRTMTEDRDPKRGIYAYIASTTLFVGSILYFAQGEEGWVRPLRVVLLYTAIAAFTVEGWRLREQRRPNDCPQRLTWLRALIMGSLILATALGELFNQPFDPVRAAARLALSALLTGLFVWLFPRFKRRG